MAQIFDDRRELQALQDPIDAPNAELVHLQSLTALRMLWLSGPQVSEVGIAGLQRALPNCYILDPQNYKTHSEIT